MQIVRLLFDAIPDLAPDAESLYVGITFGKLLLEKDRTLSLFEEDEEQDRLAEAVHAVNQKHGRMVEIGGLHGVGGQVPLRIMRHLRPPACKLASASLTGSSCCRCL
jgi:hypothetical protein